MKMHERNLPLKHVRSNDMIPGVVYGRSMGALKVQVPHKTFVKTFETYGKSAVFPCEVNGEMVNTYIKDIQRDTFNPSKIMHFDLIAVNDDDRIHATIPVLLKGKENIEKQGFVVNLIVPQLNASYKANYTPSPVVIDVSKMTIGDVCALTTLEVPSEIDIHHNKETIVLSIAKAK